MNSSNNNAVHVATTDNSGATSEQVQVQAKPADLYKFRPYDSALPIPEHDGYRHIKCLYKENLKTGKKAGENSFILVDDTLDDATISTRLPEVMPYIISYLQGIEELIVKDKHKAGSVQLSAGVLGLDSVLAYLEESGAGNRLNKEKIESWFILEVSDGLTVAFADKLGISNEPTLEETEKLAQVLLVYKAKFASLASGKTFYQKAEAELMQKALQVSGAKDSSLGARFYARLEAMKTSASEDLMLAL